MQASPDGIKLIESLDGRSYDPYALAKAESAVSRLVKVKISQNQFDALVSYAYEEGDEALAATVFLKRLNRGMYSAVPHELRLDIKVDGEFSMLRAKQRAAQAEMFTGQWEPPDGMEAA